MLSYEEYMKGHPNISLSEEEFNKLLNYAVQSIQQYITDCVPYWRIDAVDYENPELKAIVVQEIEFLETMGGVKFLDEPISGISTIQTTGFTINMANSSFNSYNGLYLSSYVQAGLKRYLYSSGLAYRGFYL